MITEVIENSNAILHKFGLKVFETISNFLKKDEEVTLSFEGVDNCTSSFCNAAIGKLYTEFPKDKVDELFHVEGIDQESIWDEKVQEAIDLALNEDKQRINDDTIRDLLKDI